MLTIDNVTADLAGAMGKGRYWYSGGEEQSLWFQSLSLVYQERDGDWVPGIAAAAGLLPKLPWVTGRSRMPLYQYRTKDRETTFLFIHVPKTGGTAIETHLRSIGLTGYFDPPTYTAVRPYLKVPPAHYDYGYLNRLFDLSKLYSFAVVRHPVKRMISEYKWALEVSTLKGSLAQVDFSGFIRRMFEEYRRDENVFAGHLKPQIRFVGEKVTKIFKYEAGLDNVVRHVLKDVGLTFSAEMKVPVVNKTSERKIIVSRGDVQLIREVYAEDFTAFGYDPELDVSET